MNTIKLMIETEQSCSMSYFFSPDELHKFKTLIINGGKEVIAGNPLSCSNDYLLHHKGKDFQGASYAMPLEGILDMVNEKVSQIKKIS